jgi:hypothetical protein
MRHAETYFAAFEEVPLTEHEAVHLETYLHDKGRIFYCTEPAEILKPG